jgi:pimeloyl-ACP methyl ester carboxylesterase
MVSKALGMGYVKDKNNDNCMAGFTKKLLFNSNPDSGGTGGDERSWNRMKKDPFFITKFLDGTQHGANTNRTHYLEVRSNWRREGSYYDLEKITCPTFIYNGRNETTTLFHAEWYKKVIPGSELIIFDEHGHGSIALEAEKIILALVQGKSIPPNYETPAQQEMA